MYVPGTLIHSMRHFYLDNNKDITNLITSQRPISYRIRHKNPQQNARKSNSATYKRDYTL